MYREIILIGMRTIPPLFANYLLNKKGKEIDQTHT
jgi:hypothetical protein